MFEEYFFLSYSLPSSIVPQIEAPQIKITHSSQTLVLKLRTKSVLNGGSCYDESIAIVLVLIVNLTQYRIISVRDILSLHV